MRSRIEDSAVTTVLWSALTLINGCPSPPPLPLDPIPLEETVETVNANLANIRSGLKAFGPVVVEYVDDSGIRHRQSLDGNLLVVIPRHLRFEMSLLSKSQILLGSNQEKFWIHIEADDDTYRWGHHVSSFSTDSRVPIRPDRVADAVGLNPIPYDTTGSMGPIQRIDEEYQQLMFMAYDDRQQGYIEKEFWVERRSPRLLRRILFRDVMGRVLMSSELDEYERLEETGVWLPTRIHMESPQERSSLDFRVRKWSFEPRLNTESPSFVAPLDLGFKFRNVICVDGG